MPEWLPLVGGILGGFAGVAALVKVILDSMRLKPDIAQLYETMATKQAQQINDLRDRVSTLEEELQEQDHYIDELLTGINKLVEQVVGQDCVPVWKPEKPRRTRKATI